MVLALGRVETNQQEAWHPFHYFGILWTQMEKHDGWILWKRAQSTLCFQLANCGLLESLSSLSDRGQLRSSSLWFMVNQVLSHEGVNNPWLYFIGKFAPQFNTTKGRRNNKKCWKHSAVRRRWWRETFFRLTFFDHIWESCLFWVAAEMVGGVRWMGEMEC